MILVKRHGLKIYNVNTDKKIPKDVVYVGRPTTFGNPYTHLKSDKGALHVLKTPALVLEEFKKYMVRNTAIAKEAKRHLKGKNLSCPCDTPCYAELLMDVANE